jgi:hypothetical protein
LITYYYFDFQDATKRNLCGLLSSLLMQLDDDSLSCWDVLYQLYTTCRNGLEQSSEAACLLPPRQAAKLSPCGCDPSWFCSPHDACFIHESCLCEGSSKWPPVKPVRSAWVSESREWLASMLSRRPRLPPSF